MKYTITEPYSGTSEATEGNLPFFYVNDQSGTVVYYAVTRAECEKWILENA